jgi:hypothetical protein
MTLTVRAAPAMFTPRTSRAARFLLKSLRSIHKTVEAASIGGL